jgi:hypothetical protein
MRRTIELMKVALAISCLVLAACGGNGVTDIQSSTNGNQSATSSLKTAGSNAVAASLSGTTIPSATQIVDASGNAWTLAAGLVYLNGAWDGYSSNVVLLLYDNGTLYQQNSSGLWFAWNGTSWSVSSDPRATASPIGTTIPSATQIVDASGDVWIVAGGVVYENGALAGYSNNVTLLLYENATIYQENSAGGWWSWNGTTWVASADPLTVAASPNGTSIPSATQIVDSSGNVWTVAGGVIYENGGLAGYSNNVTLLLYDNATIYQENSAGGWWSWNGSTWVAGSDPLNPVSPGAPPTISGSAPTSDVAGQAYSFVPTTTNPGGGTLVFSILNQPSWASFDTVTGALTGTPSNAQSGTYSNIIIGVSNGTALVALTAFSITVTPSGTANLTWTAPTENTDGTPLTDLAGYTIYYGTSSSALTQTVPVADPGATSYLINTLPTGTYYFAIAAYTTTGLPGSQSSVVSKAIP